MEPACKAIGMGEVDGVFWAEALNRPQNRWILDKPENAMASDVTFHHYCWGKLAKLRYFTAKTAEQRNGAAQGWRKEMEYVAKHANPSWPHLPLVHKEIAESFMVQRRFSEAIQAANRALELKPGFSQALLVLTDAYVELKNTSKALQVVTEGLKLNPGSKPLQRRYRDLGGKLPYPEPPPTKVETAASTAVAAEPNPGLTAAQGISDSKLEKHPQPVSQPVETSPPTQPSSNPYCRFCP